MGNSEIFGPESDAGVVISADGAGFVYGVSGASSVALDSCEPRVVDGRVSNAPRIAIGSTPVNLQGGDPADFVALDAVTLGAIATAPVERRTFIAS